MRRFSIVCFLTVLIGSVSASLWAGDERSNYIGFGYGLETCTIMTTARDERYPQVIHWLAGYLTSYNRWQPDTYDITGGPHASDWETWIQQYCMMHPTKEIAKAAAAFVTTFYPSRLTQAPAGILPPPPPTPPPARGQTLRTWKAAAPPSAIPASVVTSTQSSPRRELIRHVQERLQAAGFSAGAIERALGPQIHDTLHWFQNAKGIRATGELDETTLDALGVW